MSRSIEAVLWLAMVLASGVALAQDRYPGIGRPALPAEIRAWDIDVRPDFKGLPPGSGSVAKGRQVWDAKCASCHGVFGDSNEVFTPIVGETVRDDMTRGRVKALLNAEVQRTTLMKLSQLSTLWDYINRAMPWNAPKTLTVEEVYAVTAYILNLGGIVPDDFELSNGNVRQVQGLLPNRNGMTRDHGLWDVGGKPDVRNVACMKNCASDARIASVLPDRVLGSHGNLADQNRAIGAVRGVRTDPARDWKAAPIASSKPATGAGDAKELAQRSGCLACHGITGKLVGPGFTEIAARHKGAPDTAVVLLAKVKNGSAGAWGQVPMPPQSQVGDAELKVLVHWILGGAR